MNIYDNYRKEKKRICTEKSALASLKNQSALATHKKIVHFARFKISRHIRETNVTLLCGPQVRRSYTILYIVILHACIKLGLLRKEIYKKLGLRKDTFCSFGWIN